MATAEDVLDSLTSFAESCNGNERLRAMNKDWNRTIEIRATDLATDYTITTKEGIVAAISGGAPVADLIIQADSEILTQVFYGELSPNEPYSDGSLRAQGSEQDILHLDFITAMLWE